ncbi:putative type II restriction enzyme methylase subunit [Alteromonas alvinellae]
MNTKNLKAYAPKARRQFMEAVAKRAAHFGIYEDEFAPVSFQGSTAIIEGNAFTKQQGEQRKRLEKHIEEKPLATHKERYDLFVREMAYTWFNRLAALRYMELHDYFEHGFRVLSNPSNQDGLPEILDHAADVADMLGLDKAQIIEWQLAGDKQEVLYRELLLGQCHHLHNVMPFLFEAIDDSTELLLPDNLTKTDSILKGLVNDIPEEDWERIEVIGWLYQFYISEHKDAVIGKMVKSEDIPAATQLFTPNWIVKYLVQNSIGRQWLATYPDSSIKAKMEYYIEPAEQTDEVNAQLAAITPSSIDPESIKALDPACGSGHILVEMYEVLREIYLERGYRLREIPELILTKNIYGLDIDDRAAQLAGFALLMKAREDDRRIFQRVQDGSVKLNVYALQSTEGWDSVSLWQALNLDGKAKQGSSGDLFVETKKFDAPTDEYAKYFDLLKYLITSFEQAKTLGSLIQIDHEYLPILEKFKSELLEKLLGTDPAAVAAASQLLPVVAQATLLTQKYDAVIANPPYMGGKGMNGLLKDFAKKRFPNSKSDLFAMFIERGFFLIKESGFNAMVTMQSWMFLSGYEKFREGILSEKNILTMLHMGNGVMKIAFGTNATVFGKVPIGGYRASYSYLENDDISEKEVPYEFPVKNERFRYTISDSFNNIPGKPIAYWRDFSAYYLTGQLSDILESGGRCKTHNDEKYVRYHWEVDSKKIGLEWKLYEKGGEFRKWYGNRLYVVSWTDEAKTNYASHGGLTQSKFWGKVGITWSAITSSKNSFRLKCDDSEYSSASPTLFLKAQDSNLLYSILGALNTNLYSEILKLISPTVNANPGEVLRLPRPNSEVSDLVKELILISKNEWDSTEISLGFASFYSLTDKKEDKLRVSIQRIISTIAERQNTITELEKELEYKVYKSFTHDTECTNSEQSNANICGNENEDVSNLIIDLSSFFIGCSMGRYSLDRKGIVYAHSCNEGFRELSAASAYKTFPADDDGIIPLASEEWLFEDDATARFREFVKTVWGTKHLQENLEFAAESLCLNAMNFKKGESAMETIRRYFSTQFFTDHCKMYKKRPIYWLFSSGKEKAFECLVYLHRYNEATLSRMRTEYVTPLMGKYDHQLARKLEEVVDASGTEQRRIEREIKDLEKKQAELRKFDEELKHYAEMRISLDLDDGVKANYGKFGNLLANVKAIHGKAVK